MPAIDRENPINLTTRLVKIKSASRFSEKTDILRYVAEDLNGFDMKIVTPPNAVPCLVVRMGCAYPEFKLILSGHLNSVNEGTVREPINPLVKDGIIYERGASDMKAVVPL